jgi:hypothetical protein
MGIFDRIKAALRREDEEIIREAQEVGGREEARLEAQREDFEGHQADEVAEDELRDGHGGGRPI